MYYEVHNIAQEMNLYYVLLRIKHSINEDPILNNITKINSFHNYYWHR